MKAGPFGLVKNGGERHVAVVAGRSYLHQPAQF
jgi:hypothetical protein